MRIVNALIENLPHTSEAWEFDTELHHIYEMPEDVQWPYYYGCIPEITSGDGAPLDIFVVSSARYERGAIVESEIFDVLNFIDRGMDDPKLLAVPAGESAPTGDKLNKVYKAITSFIAAKKQHSGTEFEFKGLGGREAAEMLVNEAA